MGEPRTEILGRLEDLHGGRDSEALAAGYDAGFREGRASLGLPAAPEPHIEPEFVTWTVPGVATVELYLRETRVPISLFGHVMPVEHARRIASMLLAAADHAEGKR